jgi:hypothetical protein
MNEYVLTRRAILEGAAGLAIVTAVPSLVATTGCGKTEKPLSCSDTTTLSSVDAQVRVSLAYVDTSTEVGKSCSACQQFVPGPPDRCGACKVVKGSINPAGFCRSFLAKPPAA